MISPHILRFIHWVRKKVELDCRPQYWIKVCSCGFFSDKSFRQYSHTHLQTHTSAVISQLDPLFYLFNLFISVFVFTICSPLFPSIPLCLAQWRGEDGGTGDGGCACLCAGGAFEHSSSIATVLW